MTSPTAPIPQDAPRAPARRWARRLIKILASVVLLLTLVEVGLRVTLFTEIPRLRKATSKLRKASNFSHRWSPEYWKLLRLFANGPRRPARYDPIVGWMQDRVELGTYDHKEHDRSSGKRPVLLYGDSFAECVTGPEECWEGLLADSEFGETHQLINHGTGGHGFGQTFLLLRESIANYEGESPLVIVSLFVDDDMDRAILPFRAWPKPRLTVQTDGALGLPEPVHEGSLDYLGENPPAIFSYAWRYILHSTEWISSARRESLIGKAETFEEVRRLNGRILEEIKVLLEASGIEYFVLMFHGKGFFLDPPPENWRDGFLIGELERLGMPFVSSRTVIDEDKLATGRKAEDYFYLRGGEKGHYHALGNQIVFEAIRRGLKHRFEGQWEPDPIGAPTTVVHPGPGAFARFGEEAIRPFVAPEDTPRWVLGTEGDTPTELEYLLYGKVRSFKALLKLVPPRAYRNDGPIELSLWKDGERVLVHTLESAATPIPINLDLTDTHRFRIRVVSPPNTTTGVLVLASPAFTAAE